MIEKWRLIMKIIQDFTSVEIDWINCYNEMLNEWLRSFDDEIRRFFFEYKPSETWYMQLISIWYYYHCYPFKYIYYIYIHIEIDKKRRHRLDFFIRLRNSLKNRSYSHFDKRQIALFCKFKLKLIITIDIDC